jgi:glycosyltransferase involved in cell wall biosynthesis
VHVVVGRDDGEVTLGAIDDLEAPGQIVSMTEAALAGLTEAQPAPATPDVPAHGALTADVVRPESAVGLDWQIRTDTGWGIYGLNIALELCRRGEITPAIFAIEAGDLSPLHRHHLRHVLRASMERQDALARHPELPGTFDSVMLRALGNGFAHGPLWGRLRARRNVGMIFFEDTAIDAGARARANQLDRIVAGSSWNAEVLRATGIDHVVPVIQGIDPTIFHPAPPSRRFGDRFVVYSGGKLEYRKGQDIVIAAFRRFRERHPDALLLTAWHNSWPHLVVDLSLAGHVQGSPQATPEGMAFAQWLAANGISGDDAFDIGRVPNALMGQVIREADVALFPNRCEGGTNLVAMEAMACGVPTIVSANTGHLDLVATGGCLPLVRQTTVPVPTRYFTATEGWGESDVDEIVEALERCYTDRAEARALGARGAAAMQAFTWANQVDQLLAAVRPLL